MGNGILLCGLNGAGKSTIGRALAQSLRYHFIDHEDLFFPDGVYAAPRSREEACCLLMQRVAAHPNFVLACVKGNFGDALLPQLSLAVLVEVPRALRLQRVRQRSLDKFDDRMLPGGDLHAQETTFLQQVIARPEDYVEAWARTLPCPLLRVDGTRPVEETVARIKERLL